MRMIAAAVLSLAALLVTATPAVADEPGLRMNEVQVIGTHTTATSAS